MPQRSRPGDGDEVRRLLWASSQRTRPTDDQVRWQARSAVDELIAAGRVPAELRAVVIEDAGARLLSDPERTSWHLSSVPGVVEEVARELVHLRESGVPLRQLLDATPSRRKFLYQGRQRAEREAQRRREQEQRERDAQAREHRQRAEDAAVEALTRAGLPVGGAEQRIATLLLLGDEDVTTDDLHQAVAAFESEYERRVHSALSRRMPLPKKDDVIAALFARGGNARAAPPTPEAKTPEQRN